MSRFSLFLLPLSNSILLNRGFMCTKSFQSKSLMMLLLFYLFMMPSIGLAKYLSPDVLNGNLSIANLKVEYPFGLSHALPGFKVNYNFKQNSVPTITLGRTSFQLLNISLEGGYIRVLMDPTTWQCGSRPLTPPGRASTPPGRASTRNQTKTQLAISLEGTPFTFSHERNKLNVLGCDSFVVLNSSVINVTDGCVSICSSQRNIRDGNCAGVGCCQSSIPPGLKSFNLERYSIKNLTSSSINGTSTCTQYFVGEMDSSEFKRRYVVGSGEVTSWPVVLDWAIGNESCLEAKSKAGDVCQKNSLCYNVTGGKGYRCNCSEGFQGNPYIPGGCHDIDECENPKKHNCSISCENLPGSFRCICPPGMKGDGLKGGSGCENSKSHEVLDISLGLGLILLAILFVVGVLTYWALKKQKIMKTRRRYFMQNGGMLLQQSIYSRQRTAQIFTIEELRRATNGFSEDQVIGKGGYGTVYKGLLPDGQVVAIKKSKLVDESQIEQFINEVVILSQINHKNVVKLLGCCLEDPVPLLVYEFISNGTLFHHIHENSDSPLSWENRLRIATETAGAIAYLHCKAAIPIIHRDIKLTNILLDENYTAKVSDFGASRLVGFNQTHITTLVQGTLGYLDPEYFYTSQLTEKSDVYSFGVVLMEMLTSERPVSYWKSENERNLASHFVTSLRRRQLSEVIDSRLLDQVGPLHLYAVADLASRCVKLKCEERPTMYEVAVELDALRRLLKNQFVMLVLDKEQLRLPRERPLNVCTQSSNREISPEISLLSSIGSSSVFRSGQIE